MALTLLKQLASMISQLSCFAPLEGGEDSVLYGSSIGSHKESNVVYEMSEGRELYCSPKSGLKPNLLVTVQALSSQVRGACITWASTFWRHPAELWLLAQKWSGMLFALPQIN